MTTKAFTTEIFRDLWLHLAMPEDYRREAILHELRKFTREFFAMPPVDALYMGWPRRPEIVTPSGRIWIIPPHKQDLADKFLEHAIEIGDPEQVDGAVKIRFTLSLLGIEEVKRKFRLFAPRNVLDMITENGPIIHEEPSVDECIYQFCLWRIRMWPEIERVRKQHASNIADYNARRRATSL